MISVVCDKCERTIEVPDDQAGKKFPCPHCGDINTTPDVDAGGEARLEAKGLPSAHGPERTIRRVRPAMFRGKPIRFTILVLMMLAGFVSAVVFAIRGNTWLLVLGAAVFLVAGAMFAAWWLQVMGVALQITNKRTVLTKGLLSKATNEVDHNTVRNIQVTQSFWNRIWGVGHIGISSSGQSGIEISTPDVERPFEIVEIINAYRDLE